ncbi:MAG: c-type cytochrome, partial [Planctomycetota bacterium]
LLFAAAVAAQHGDRADADRSELPPELEVPPAPARTAAEQLATFRLADGFALELVACEPLLGDPVQAVFDAAGRLWVVEMRGYMPDIDGVGEQAPNGRIAVLQDDDGDGRMDTSTPFVEGVVLPRAVLPLAGGALVIAPPELLWMPDRDGDLRADGREVLAGDFEAGLQNPEHSGNGLLWALDNRIHLAGDRRMLRWRPGGASPQFALEDGAGGGQWGIAQDDRGRLYFNYNEDWLRCDLVPGRYGARHRDADRAPPRLPVLNHRVVADRSVWPIRVTPGVNRGGNPGILRDGKLARHTAACAPFVLRGDALPGCDGDVFVCDPAANVVRRLRRAELDGAMTAGNPHGEAEFLASTDERFRPVNLTQGPDGALYVVDMYRGVIQHRNFVTTFLRRQVEARGLEQPIGMGRIWRVVAADAARRPARTLADADGAGLVAALGDADGWRRDTAQRLIVQRQQRDAASALRELLRAAPAPVARRHAFAALEGLDALTDGDVAAALQDADVGVLCQAIGSAAALWSRGDGAAWSRVAALREHPSPCVQWHLALALGDVTGDGAERAWTGLVDLALLGEARPRLRACVADSVYGREPDFVRALLAAGAASQDLLRELARNATARRSAATHEELLRIVAACMQPERQVALLRGMIDALPGETAARAGWLRFAATPPALAAIAGTGQPAVQPLVQELLAAIELRADEAAEDAAAAPDADLTPAQRARAAAGAAIYGTYCSACHQPDGRGMPGLAPPLRESEWVTGDPVRLVRIALHGLRGPVTAAGVHFDGEMPGQRHLRDEDLAAALTWLRRTWGHRASAIEPAEVAAERASGREGPWTAAELAPR